MPVEAGYQSQLDPREAAPRPLQNAAALGGQVGEALQQAGGMVHEQELRAYEIERKAVANQELASASRAFAEHRRAMGDQVRTLRESAGPGGEGHSEAVDQANEAGRAAVLDTISDPTIARHLKEQWGEWSNGLHGSEATWQQGKRIERLVDDTGEGNNLTGNIIRAGGGDKDIYAKELDRRFKDIALLEVDEDTREKLYRDAESSAGLGFLLGLQDKDPAAAQAAIDSGGFNFLPGGTLEQLRNGNAVEQRRIEGEEEHKRRLAMAQGKDAIGVVEQKSRDGIPQADADFDAAIALSESMGDNSKAESLRGMKADNVNARVWNGQTPLARQNRVAALGAKGNKRSDAESREFKWLTDHRDALDKTYGSDPVAFAIEHAPAGTGPPAGDIRLPGGLQGRIDWSRRAGPSYGRGQMPLFTRIEADAFARRKGEGQDGQQEVLTFLDQIPDEGVRKLAAAQIDPNDKVFQQLTLLNPQSRHSVFYGAQALKANPQMLTPDKDHPDVLQWIGGQNLAFNEATKFMAPADRAAMQNVAMMFMAGQLSGQNKTVNQANPEQLRIGFMVAAGGTYRPGPNGGQVQHGGFMTYKDGQTFLAPTNLSYPLFVKAAQGDMLTRKVSPQNPDGSVAELRFAHPVFIGIDPKDPAVWLYHWETPQGRVIDQRGGSKFVSRVRNPD